MTLLPSIYVIDDDEPTLQSLLSTLEVWGYSAFGFASGTEFLEQWSAEAAGVVVSDIRIPGMNGISLARRLKEMGASLPIILVTGYADESVREEAISAGAVAVLEKPYPFKSLIAAIERASASATDSEPENKTH